MTMIDTNATIPTANDPVSLDHNNPPSLLDSDGLLRRFGNAEEPGVYTPLIKDVADLLADLRASVPDKIETEHDNGIVAAHMEELRKTIKTVENHHAREKAPYLTAGRGVDQFFFGMRDRLAKARDIIQERGNDYTRRKIAEEKAERNRLARIAADAAAAAAAEASRKDAERRALEAAAERARKPENIAKLEQAAEQKGAEAVVAQVDQMVAASTAENAMLASLASSADIARTRHASGHLSTAKQVPHVEIVDKAKLDLAALLPFIKEDELLRALKAWAKVTDHKKPMDGAIIEFRDKADYR